MKKAIAVAGIPCQDYDVSGNPHIGLKNCPCPEKFKFAFVRHPVSLYRSYWQFKMTSGWDPDNPIDQTCQSDDFQQFIRHVLDQFSGVYGNSLIEFVGDVNNEIEFIGKYEHMVDDLIAALTAAGETFDAQAIRTQPPYNVSDKARFPAVYTVQLEAEIKQAEHTMVKRFGYV